MPKDSIKGIRTIIAGIAIFFVVFVAIRIFFDQSKNITPLLPDSTTIFIGIWVIIILFSLTFLFILIRNIIKLYYEREKEYSGGRFKRRLVFFFIAFSIIPTLLLFLFATELINNSIDKLFNPQIDTIMSRFSGLEESYYQKAQEELVHFSTQMIEDPKGIKAQRMYTEDNHVYLRNYIRREMRSYKLDVVNVYLNRKEILTQFKPDIPLQEYKDLSREDVFAGLSGRDFIRRDSLKNGELIRSGITFDTPQRDKVLVVIGKFFPDVYIKNLRDLIAMVDNYSRLKSIRNPVRTTYILLFLFVTILIIFSASWLGLYLARGITTPIEKVVEAASQIAGGNLDVKIDYSARDEFGVLINEFNHMVADLKENRNKLSKRTMELRQRRSITENILQNITSGVLALDSKGNIIEINPGAERMLSLHKDKVVNSHFSKILSKTLYHDLNSMVDKAFKTKFKLLEKEMHIKRRGKVLNLATKITQIRNPINNKFSGILVVLTDLTELIKAQRLLVWREVAKRIAHEIKNPLTPITISSQRIFKAMELTDDKFRKVVEDSLNIIQQELESIKNLAEEFGNFARLPKMKFTKGDINDILEKLVSVYSSIYNNVEFKANLDVDIPMLVKLDVEQIKRVFVNIIDNAIESIEEKGTIDIVSKYDKGSQFIRVEIADNGPGINDEDKQKLFLPYFSKKSSGTGLGLAICHDIVEEHNGVISAVDNKPKGTRFIIEIPS